MKFRYGIAIFILFVRYSILGPEEMAQKVNILVNFNCFPL